MNISPPRIITAGNRAINNNSQRFAFTLSPVWIPLRVVSYFESSGHGSARHGSHKGRYFQLLPPLTSDITKDRQRG